jgi:glycosyltransferase involved in cell wall biosynthesis
MASPRHILHLITGLELGGAEIMLCRTLEGTDRARFSHSVICLRSRGPLADRLERAGAREVLALDMRGPASGIVGFARLVAWMVRNRPDVVQTWLTHATLIGSLAAWAAGRPPLLWSLHTGNQNPARLSRSIRWMNRLLAPLSHLLPDRIVSCSRAVMDQAVRSGWAADRLSWIPNGTDTAVFRPRKDAGKASRASLGLPRDAPVVGFVGRFTPEKDVPSFLRAAVFLQRSLPEARFVLCGTGLDPRHPALAPALRDSPHPERFVFLGPRTDLPEIYPAFSLFALTSVSEAAPLCLAEAMACGVPAVATDVGDCRELVGETGRVVPVGAPEAIAAAWSDLLALPDSARTDLAIAARERVLARFSLAGCLERYHGIYEALAGRFPKKDKKIRVSRSVSERNGPVPQSVPGTR